VTYSVLAVLWVAVIAVLASSFSELLVKALRLQFANLDLPTIVAPEGVGGNRQCRQVAFPGVRQPRSAASRCMRSVFVGALGDRALDGESRRLVSQIQNSVGALDGLFGAILDISRLDAGVIESRPRSFAIQPLLERICREEMPEVKRKGIALHLIPCSLSVQTDPVLFERVLRNLLSNAVRYTDKGRVVIGCRRGKRLSVEIWDTGCGIPADQEG